MRPTPRLVPLLLGLALLGTAPGALAQTSVPAPVVVPAGGGPIHVSPTGNPASDGKTWATAVDDVQLGVKLASQTAGKEVWIAAGTYKQATPIDLGGQASKLYGGFAGTETQLDQRDWEANVVVLDGGGATRLFKLPDLHGPDTILDGFTIRNGQADRGGGMYLYNASPTLRHVVFEGNRTIPPASGAPSDADGGGLYCYGGSPLIEGCTFVNNAADDDGGGLYVYSGKPIVRECVFLNNTAKGDGGAVWCYEGAAKLWNCALRANLAGGTGGALWAYSAPLELLQSTVVENTAQQGGGIASVQGLALVRNSIVHGNLAPADAEIHGAPAVSYSCVQGGYAGPGNVAGQPSLVDPAGGDFTPGPGSVCLDAGDSGALNPSLTTDLHGSLRQVDLPGVPDSGAGPPPAVDMGAVERQILPALEASPGALSLAAGGVLTMQLGAPQQHAGYPYLVLGSTGGTAPGLPLGPHLLPLNVDPYFGWTLANPNVFPLSNTFGTLDSAAQATASFTLVAGSPAQWAGAYVHHAYVVFQLAPTVDVSFTSNAVELLLAP